MHKLRSDQKSSRQGIDRGNSLRIAGEKRSNDAETYIFFRPDTRIGKRDVFLKGIVMETVLKGEKTLPATEEVVGLGTNAVNLLFALSE
jgi:hypothetical protein